MKKKLILLTIFLLFSTSVLAQNFNIRILNYDPETGNARIRIENTASTDFHDLKLKIDNQESALTEFLEAGSAFATFQIISPGEHSITITTKEGISETKSLYFSPTEAQLKEIISAKKGTTKEPTVKIPEKKFNYLYIFLILIALIIIYWLYKKYKNENI